VPVIPPDPFAADDVPTGIPAATVIPLRDGPDGLETLLVRRNANLAFAGGHWVWPGGRLDPADLVAAGLDPSTVHLDDDLLAAARIAAAREAAEEASLVVPAECLTLVSHWTPPAVNVKRFRTFFFAVTLVDEHTIEVDGGEILEHRWQRPADTLAERDAGTVELSPPTVITLCRLLRHATAADVHCAAMDEGPEIFATRFATVPGGAVACYFGDAALPDGGGEITDPDAPGPRHRLWMVEGAWRYERDV